MELVKKIDVPVINETRMFSSLSREGKSFPLLIYKGKYPEGGNTLLFVTTEDGEPFGKVTVNIPGVRLEDDEVLVKNYSENEPWIWSLFENGIISETGLSVPSGWTNIPICKILV
jgi:hypothetical protein